MNNKSKNMIVCLCIILTAFFFGTMEIALKLAGAHLNAIQLTFIRFFIGGIILLPFGIIDLKKRKVKLTCGDFIYLIVLGIICVCISMSLFQIGVMKTNASLAAVIISINPVFTMVFAHFMTEDKFTVKKAIVLAMNIIGLIIVANPFSLSKGNNIVGILTVLVASVAFGLYTALGKKRIAKIGNMAQNSLSFIFGCSVLFIAMLIGKVPVVSGINKGNILLIMYLAIFVTGVGYICFGKAIALSNPSTASIAFFIKPVIATILAFFILDEKVTVNIIIGIIVIITGSLINLLWKTKKTK